LIIGEKFILGKPERFSLTYNDGRTRDEKAMSPEVAASSTQ